MNIASKYDTDVTINQQNILKTTLEPSLGTNFCELGT